MSKPAARKGVGGRPIGPLTKKIKHFDRPSSRQRIETDADQLRIKLAIDTKYAGAPDMGRVIPKGSPEFERIAAELLARENKTGGDMGTKGKVCDVDGCSAFQWKAGKCWRHHPEHVAKREAKAAAKVAAVPPPVAEPVADLPANFSEPVGMQFCEECGVIPCACFDEVALPIDFGKVVSGDGEPVPLGVDPVILLALREAWAAKEAAWLVELSGLKPGKAVCRAAGMVKAVEGLGY